MLRETTSGGPGQCVCLLLCELVCAPCVCHGVLEPEKKKCGRSHWQAQALVTARVCVYYCSTSGYNHDDSESNLLQDDSESNLLQTCTSDKFDFRGLGLDAMPVTQ